MSITERNKRIIEYRQAGKTVKWIGKKVGLHFTTVWKIANGYKRQGGARKVVVRPRVPAPEVSPAANAWKVTVFNLRTKADEFLRVANQLESLANGGGGIK